MFNSVKIGYTQTFLCGGPVTIGMKLISILQKRIKREISVESLTERTVVKVPITSKLGVKLLLPEIINRNRNHVTFL